MDTFFHPLDRVGRLEPALRPPGFLQHQFVVPFGAEAALRRGRRADLAGRGHVVPGRAEALRARQRGARSRSPWPGGRWRSTCPASRAGLADLLDGLDEHGRGRRRPSLPGQGQPHDPALLTAMYPDLAEWQGGAGDGRSRRRPCSPTSAAGSACACPGGGTGAVRNALGDPQSIAGARRHERHRPGHRPPAACSRPRRTVVLAARRPEQLDGFVAELRATGATTVDDPGLRRHRTSGHAKLIGGGLRASRRPRRRPARVRCSSTRPQLRRRYRGRRRTQRSRTTSGRSSTGLLAAEQFRRQGHGLLVVLSSVAGERVRKANFVYGSTKAGPRRLRAGAGRRSRQAPARRCWWCGQGSWTPR